MAFFPKSQPQTNQTVSYTSSGAAYPKLCNFRENIFASARFYWRSRQNDKAAGRWTVTLKKASSSRRVVQPKYTLPVALFKI